MLATTYHFAAASTGLAGLFSALGLDLRALVVNATAFLIIVILLARFVYPSLNRALDHKRSEIEAVSKFKREAAAALDAANKTASDIINQAHRSADELIDAASAEARATIEQATARAAAEAKQIVADAHEQLEHDVAAARRVLVGETARLVARASEHLTGDRLDAGRDSELIERSLKAARR